MSSAHEAPEATQRGVVVRAATVAGFEIELIVYLDLINRGLVYRWLGQSELVPAGSVPASLSDILPRCDDLLDVGGGVLAGEIRAAYPSVDVQQLTASPVRHYVDASLPARFRDDAEKIDCRKSAR